MAGVDEAKELRDIAEAIGSTWKMAIVLDMGEDTPKEAPLEKAVLKLVDWEKGLPKEEWVVALTSASAASHLNSRGTSAPSPHPNRQWVMDGM